MRYAVARAFALLGTHRDAAFLYVATMAASVIAFGYQFLMARLLVPAEYAILTALFGWLLLESISTQVIQSAAASLAARYRARGDEPALHAFARTWLARIALVAGPPGLLLVLLAVPFGAALALPPITVALLGTTLFSSALLTFAWGLLQGLHRFGWLGAMQLLLATTRLGLGAALVLLGLGVSGAFLAASVAPPLALACSLLVLAPLLRRAPRRADGSLGASETRFFLFAAIVLLAYAALTNMDAVLARPLLGPEEAGTYAGVVTLGKVILFAPLAVGFILLERTARAHARGEDTERGLFLALGFVLATSGVVALAYLWRPALFTAIVVGSQYPGAAALAGRYGIAALANSLLSIWIAYFVGLGEMRVGLVLALGVAAELAGLLSLARDGSAMVTIVLATALAMQAAAVATFLLERRRQAAT